MNQCFTQTFSIIQSHDAHNNHNHSSLKSISKSHNFSIYNTRNEFIKVPSFLFDLYDFKSLKNLDISLTEYYLNVAVDFKALQVLEDYLYTGVVSDLNIDECVDLISLCFVLNNDE